MKNYEVRVSRTIEYPWTEGEPFFVGQVPKGLGTPAYYCVVAEDEEPYLLVHVYDQGAETQIWHQWLVLGLSQEIVFISLDLNHRRMLNYSMWSNMSAFYSFDESLLVVTDALIACYDQEARQVWESQELSQSGIRLSWVQDSQICGLSECPPACSPPGPAEFLLDQHSGKLLSIQYKPPRRDSSGTR